MTHDQRIKNLLHEKNILIDLCRELIKETYGLHENEVGTPVNRRACRVDVKKIDQIDCMLQRLEKELEDG